MRDRTTHLTAAEGEDVVLLGLTEGELQASVDDVLAGLQKHTRALAAPLPVEAKDQP